MKIEDFKIGMRVTHKEYGKGFVLQNSNKSNSILIKFDKFMPIWFSEKNSRASWEIKTLEIRCGKLIKLKKILKLLCIKALKVLNKKNKI
jgi:hypothetical protein